MEAVPRFAAHAPGQRPILQVGATVRGCSTISPDEPPLLRAIAETDCDDADPTTFYAYADLLEEHGQGADGHRRLAECIQVGALRSAYRVTATWEECISPRELARCLASICGAQIADGSQVHFVCGPTVREAVRRHPRVDKADSYPSLEAAHLPPHYLTEESDRILRGGSFNTAILNGESLYVFQDLETMTSTLSRIPLAVLV